MKLAIILILLLVKTNLVFPQFIDHFNDNKPETWDYFSGDGNLKMDFYINNGIGNISIDATKDQYNVWWAVIRRNVTRFIDIYLLQKNDYELRIEVKLKIHRGLKIFIQI